MSPRTKKQVEPIKGQLSFAPEKPIEFDNYEVGVDQINDPLLGTVNIDRAFVDSVGRMGILMSVLLRKIPAEGGGVPQYRVIAGRRRIRAALLNNLPKVPARVPRDDDGGWTDDALLASIENELRSPNPVATLAHIEDMMVRGYSEKDIATAVGIDVKKVRRYLGFQRLNPRLMRAFVSGEIASAVAERASKLPAAYQQKLVAILDEKGTLKGADIRTVQEIKKEDIRASLPDSLFDSLDATLDVTLDERDAVVSEGTKLLERLIVLFPGIEPKLDEIRSFITREGGIGIADVPELPDHPPEIPDDEDELAGATEMEVYDGAIRVPVVTKGEKDADFIVVSQPEPVSGEDTPY